MVKVDLENLPQMSLFVSRKVTFLQAQASELAENGSTKYELFSQDPLVSDTGYFRMVKFACLYSFDSHFPYTMQSIVRIEITEFLC